MSDRDALVWLCGIHGIAPDYYDIWGTRHEVSDANLRALLGALGVRAGNAGEVEQATHDAECERWQRVLPETLVLREEAAPWTLRLNLRAGLADAPLAWRLTEEDGTRHEAAFEAASLHLAESVDLDGERGAGRDFVLPRTAPCGYHRLAILHQGSVLAEATLIVTPSRCYRPPAVESAGRVWGAAVQLYAVRSGRNWGMGDFTDLAAIVAQWGSRGAALVGVNPLHALYPHNPEHASPYSPSSRRFFNVLYLDVEAVEDFRDCAEALAELHSPAFRARLQALRETDRVDYAGVAAAKLPMLDRACAHFRAHHLAANTPRAQAFRAFQAAHAPALRRQALFEALQERFHSEDARIWGWPVWPEAYRDPASPAVARFAEEQAERVEFYEYLQWQAELQLAAVAARSSELGLGVGLYSDLAVSVDGAGAGTWSNQHIYAVAASVGCPPDDFNLHGQDWGLPPFVPEYLRKAGFGPFISTLRANMRHAGALRIDHVMGLGRLFWVPRGGKPDHGAYVHYPFDDLVGIVALESQRNRCMVIGEDLGTVTDEARAILGRAGILSYRVLYFERQQSGEFKLPSEYPEDALVTAATHDLPTLAGFWEGRDLGTRAELGLFPSEATGHAQAEGRVHDRWRLLRALEHEGLLPEGASADPASMPQMTDAFLRQLHAYLARSRARVLVVQLEDVLGVRDQANFPGTTTEWPNWHRKLPLALERWPEDERFIALTRLLGEIRPPAPRDPAAT